MKRILILLLFIPMLMGALYVSRAVNQTWDLTKPDIIDQLDALSGKWDIIKAAKLNEPFLSQEVKYADFPKILLKDKDFYDFNVSTRMYISSEGQDTQSAGLVFRYRNLYSFYMLFLNTKDKRLTLTRAAMGGLKVLKRVNHDFQPDRWYELKASCSLNRIKAFVDGNQILEAEDNTSTGGKVGLVSAGTTRVYFDKLTVNSEVIEATKQQ